MCAGPSCCSTLELRNLPCANCGKPHTTVHADVPLICQPAGVGNPARGRWHDTNALGESLDGYWEHGEPCGPFVTCETGTGFRITSINVGYCKHHVGNKVGQEMKCKRVHGS